MLIAGGRPGETLVKWMMAFGVSVFCSAAPCTAHQSYTSDLAIDVQTDTVRTALTCDITDLAAAFALDADSNNLVDHDNFVLWRQLVFATAFVVSLVHL